VFFVHKKRSTPPNKETKNLIWPLHFVERVSVPFKDPTEDLELAASKARLALVWIAGLGGDRRRSDQASSWLGVAACIDELHHLLASSPRIIPSLEEDLAPLTKVLIYLFCSLPQHHGRHHLRNLPNLCPLLWVHGSHRCPLLCK
jgi:hypothetical protein